MFVYVNNDTLFFPDYICTFNKEYLLFHVENQSCHSKKGILLFQARAQNNNEKNKAEICV